MTMTYQYTSSTRMEVLRVIYLWNIILSSGIVMSSVIARGMVMLTMGLYPSWVTGSHLWQ